MKRYIIIVLFFVAFVLSGETLKNRGHLALESGFDFTRQWQWEELDRVADLKQIVAIEDARFLLLQLSRLNNPGEIQRLLKYQKQQEEWGAGFYGMLPDFLAEAGKIPEPGSLDNIIQTALHLARVREKNLQTIAEKYKEFPLHFKKSPEWGNSFEWNVKAPDSMRLELDLTAVSALLALFKKENVSIDDAAQVAGMPVFTEMLKHRRELGYVPPPLPTKESLAHLFMAAASREPLDMIWKWLNPWNFFSTAGVFMKRRQYETAVTNLKNAAEDISGYVMRRIARYAPPNTVLNETLGFGVNWGVQSWATTDALGTNIVMFKNNSDILLRTITHETYHRLQLKVCPIDPTKRDLPRREFEHIVSYPFKEKSDRKFYRVLAHIVLEGTATYVGGPDRKKDYGPVISKGVELLNEVYAAVYDRKDLEKVDALLTKGLKSNGPFYILGDRMTRDIVFSCSDREIGRLLAAGSLDFFGKYLEPAKTTGKDFKSLEFDPRIAKKIAELKRKKKVLEEKQY
ncbi:MAG: hypothetical protein GY950_12225 [bacterium]|nr:hypothetical protein [bacterium]